MAMLQDMGAKDEAKLNEEAWVEMDRVMQTNSSGSNVDDDSDAKAIEAALEGE